MSLPTKQPKFRIKAIGVKAARAIVGCFALGTLLMLSPLIIDASFGKFIVGIIIVAVPLLVMWFGLSQGTFITIDENNDLYGTVLFIRFRKTPLSAVTELSTREKFMGGMTDINLTFRNKKGILETRGLVSKTALEKKDLEKLVEAIRATNPNIETSKDLLG